MHANWQQSDSLLFMPVNFIARQDWRLLYLIFIFADQQPLCVETEMVASVGKLF